MNPDHTESQSSTFLKETKALDTADIKKMDWETGQILLDEYQITGVLGKGMGIVYRVEPFKFTGPPMALKTLFSDTLSSADYKRGLMNELRVWIELPDHPHFTTFRFFRTIQDRICLFLDYIEGGSLEDWISQQKLLSLDTILDVAIQFAWAIESLHALEVVHQDIKPKNVLLTMDGQVKLTDFGLAQARGLINSTPPGSVDFCDFEVSFRGGTKGYCSPRQFTGQKLTLHTDIWSFGVSILQIFTGDVFWENGAMIPLYLHTKYKPGGYAPIPRMPESILHILKRCFEHDRTKRWNAMSDVSDALISAYEQETGLPYPRPKLELHHPTQTIASPFPESTPITANWIDPMDYIQKSEDFKLKSRTGEDLLPQKSGQRKTQALIDLQIYEEIAHFKFFSTRGRQIDEDVARLFLNKGFVHQYVHDLPGALSCFDSAITILEDQINRLSKRELLSELADAFLQKSTCSGEAGRLLESLDLIDRSLEIYERLVQQPEGHRLEASLAKSCIRKAGFLKTLGRIPDSIANLDRAIAILTRIPGQDDPDIQSNLSLAYLNKATALKECASYRNALDYFDLAIAMFIRLLDEHDRKDLEPALAMTFMNKAATLNIIGLHEEALEYFDRSIAIRQRLINNEGRVELESQLAVALMNKGSTLDDLNRFDDAMDHYNRSIAILERLIERQGRRELEEDLAMTLANKGAVLASQNLREQAIEVYFVSFQIYDRLIQMKGRRDLELPLSMVFMNLAISLMEVGRFAESLESFDKSIVIRERLVHEEGRKEILSDLCWARLGRVQTLVHLGDVDRARREARSEFEVLQSEYRRTGRADLKAVIEYAEKAIEHLFSDDNSDGQEKTSL